MPAKDSFPEGHWPRIKREDLPIWQWAKFEYLKKKGLGMLPERQDIPIWQWAELEIAERKRFPLPPDIPLENMPEAFRKEAAAMAGKPSESPLEEGQDTFRYAEIKTQFCVDDDLCFCECLARVHGRLLENGSEKIFLRGNAFLSKIAKAIFEQDGELFADACGKYKDESYFRECAETLKQWNFTAGEEEEFGRESWLSLYNVVLLLAGEYLATKCELPKVTATECGGNSDDAATLEIILAKPGSAEEDLKDAALAPIKPGGLYGPSRLDDSSDCIEAGELFYEFLGENLPKAMQADFKSMPKPAFKICAMESNQLGCYADKTISLNQRMALNAISGSQKARFYLFLTMLIEYGRFFNEAMREKKKPGAWNSDIDGGIDFMEEFMGYPDGKFFKGSFEFADFIAPDAKGGKQRFVLGISDLGYEDRERSFYIACSSGN